MKKELIILITLSLVSCGLPDSNALSQIEVKSEPMMAFKIKELNYNLNKFINLQDYDLVLPSFTYSVPRVISTISEEREVDRIVTIIDLSNPEEGILDAETLKIKNLEVESVKVKEGKIKISIPYNSDALIEVRFSSDEIKDSDGNPLMITIFLPRTTATEEIVSAEVDLADYTLNPNNNKIDLKRIIVGKIEKGDVYSRSELKSFKFKIEGIKPEYIKSKFDSHTIEVANEKVKITGIKTSENFRVGESGHKLILDIINPFAVPLDIVFSKFEISRLSNKEIKQIDFTSDVGENRVRIDAAELKEDNTIIPKITSFTLSAENSNIEEFLVLDMSAIESEITAIINPESNRDVHTITENTSSKIIIKADFPTVISGE